MEFLRWAFFLPAAACAMGEYKNGSWFVNRRHFFPAPVPNQPQLSALLPPKMLRLCLLQLWGAALLLQLMNIQSCSASLAEANAASLAFRAGILFSKSASQNQQQQKVDNQLATAGEIEPQPVAGAASADSASADSSAVGCQKLLLTHPIKLGIVEVHRAGLKQLLAGRKQLCRSFGADANACLNSQQFLKEVGELASPPSSLLIARAICRQFAEALATNEQCIGELALDRLERQCADACHRRAHPSEQPLSSRHHPGADDPEAGWASHLAQSSLHLGGTDGLCQLSLCASNCLGAQLAECAAENQQQQQNGQQQAEQLKQLVSRLAGLQMLAGIQQQQNGSGGAAQAAPAECARIVEEAVASSPRHADASVNLSTPN